MTKKEVQNIFREALYHACERKQDAFIDGIVILSWQDIEAELSFFDNDVDDFVDDFVQNDELVELWFKAVNEK